MKRLIIIAALLLSACGQKVHVNPITSVAPPVLPPNLAHKASALPPITDNTMGGSQVQGAKDDQQYNAVAFQLNALIDVYDCVRTSIIQGTDAKDCLK